MSLSSLCVCVFSSSFLRSIKRFGSTLVVVVFSPFSARTRQQRRRYSSLSLPPTTVDMYRHTHTSMTISGIVRGMPDLVGVARGLVETSDVGSRRFDNAKKRTQSTFLICRSAGLTPSPIRRESVHLHRHSYAKPAKILADWCERSSAAWTDRNLFHSK